MTRVFYGWWVAFGSFVTLFIIVGILYYGFPVFYPALIADFHWTRAQTTAGYMISTLVIGPLFGIFAGILIDRFGSKRIMLAGILAAGAALLSFSFMTSLTQFYIFYFLHTIGYACSGPLPNQVLVSQWFNRLRGRVMGLAYLGIGIGGWLAPRISHFLISNFGWRNAFQTLSATVFIVVLPLVLLLVKSRPAEKGLLPDGASAAETANRTTTAGHSYTLQKAIRRRAFWAIALGSFLSIASIGAIIQHFVLYLRDVGFSGEHASRVLSYLVLSSIPGRIIMGYLADIFPKKYVMLAAYLFVGGAVPLLFLADTGAPQFMYWIAFVFGFGMGADYMMIPLVTAESFGLSSMGKIMGVIFVTDTLGQAIFPFVVGYTFDQTGNYHIGFTLVTAAALLGAMAVLFIPRTGSDSRP